MNTNRGLQALTLFAGAAMAACSSLPSFDHPAGSPTRSFVEGEFDTNYFTGATSDD